MHWVEVPDRTPNLSGQALPGLGRADVRLTANCDHTTTRAYCCFVFGDVIDEDADGDGDGPSGSSHFFGPVGSSHPLSLPMQMLMRLLLLLLLALVLFVVELVVLNNYCWQP